MNKESLTERPLSPKEKQDYGYNLGKGLYSALQLKNILRDGGDREEPEEDKFVIKIPKEKLMAKKSSSFMVDTLLKPSISAIQGIRDTGVEHTKTRKDHLKKQLEEAQEEYLKALMHTKKASLKISTPNVDAFCMGVLSSLEKNSEESISDGSLIRSTKNLAHPITKHIPSPSSLYENFVEKPALTSILATYLMRNLDKKENTQKHSPLNISVEAV